MKKLVTTLAMGALAVACAFGFTACGGNNTTEVPKGKEVTEEEWKTAIEATLAATNYTVDIQMTHSSEYKSEGEEAADTDNTTMSGSLNITADKVYGKQTINTKMTGEHNAEIKTTYESYMTVEGSVFWQAALQKVEYIQGAPEGEEEEESKWYADKEECASETAAKEKLTRYLGIGEDIGGSFATTEGSTEYKELVDLYSSFTYADGKYTATLYHEYQGEIKAEISIKDGYVVGYSYTYADERSGEGYTAKEEGSYTYVFKNYGSTKVTAPAGATAAINDAKAK